MLRHHVSLDILVKRTEVLIILTFLKQRESVSLMATGLLFLVSYPFVKKINKMTSGRDMLCMSFFQIIFQTNLVISETIYIIRNKTDLL